jgi:hypothetical protein
MEDIRRRSKHVASADEGAFAHGELLYNVYQKVTWDASVDQGDYRVGIAGNVMKGDLQERISRACNIAIEADTVNDDDGKYYE